MKNREKSVEQRGLKNLPFLIHSRTPVLKKNNNINRSTVDPQEVTALWEGPTSRLTVTGECGDQIFGSQLLEVESGGMVLGGLGWECFRWGSFFFFGEKKKATSHSIR